jgi:purine nucleosidase
VAVDSEAVPVSDIPGGSGRSTRLVLDTDIGTDVDDVLALGVLLGSPELTLAGVTTVYGDVLLRARMVRRTLGVAGAGPLPVVPGIGTPRSGKEVYWEGHEGRLMPDLDREEVDLDLDAPALLAAGPVALAIGPLTNLAAAVETEGHGLAHVVVMGGDFAEPGRPEHNLKSDVDAAVAVFESGVPITALGIDQTERARLTVPELERIRAAGPLGELLAAEVDQYWAATGRDWNVPHDPLTVLLLTQPGLFRLERGRVTVDAAGATSFTRDPAGPHSIVVDLDVPGAVEALVQRIEAAGRR